MMHKTIKTDLCEVLGIDVPIIQAPLGVAITPEFLKTVAEYGALATLPIGRKPLAECEKMIDETLALTDGPIAANLILAFDQTECVDLCLKKGIKIIWFFWGDPSPFIDKIHSHGGKVILSVGSADEAKRSVDAGVDVIVAQGWEAGGHLWGTTATMSLIPAVVDAVAGRVSVVMAGGVADGRGLAASLALGASGVVIGTRLLATHEANIHGEYKARLIEGKADDTVYTDFFDKGWPDAPIRTLNNSTYQQWVKAGKPKSGDRPGENDIITHYKGTPVERYSIFIPSPEMEGDLEPMVHYAGQTVELVREQKSIHEVFDEVISGAIVQLEKAFTSVAGLPG